MRALVHEAAHKDESLDVGPLLGIEGPEVPEGQAACGAEEAVPQELICPLAALHNPAHIKLGASQQLPYLGKPICQSIIPRTNQTIDLLPFSTNQKRIFLTTSTNL